MKTLIITFFITVGCASAKAQLANTKWSGTMNVPTQEQALLTFTADTLSIDFPNIVARSEVMTYKVKDGIIYLKKIDGGSHAMSTGNLPLLTC